MDKMINKKFGRLTVLKENGRKHNWKTYFCKCDCGNTCTCIGSFLRLGKTKSCGCLHKEISSRTMRNNFKKYNEIIIGKEKAYIVLNNSEKAIIDLNNVQKCKPHRWYKAKNGYATSHIDGKIITLHKFLIDTKKIIDHIDRNKLNNMLKNLIETDYSINNFNKNIRNNNKSGVTGVRFVESRNKWEAYITKNKKRIFLGYYDDKSSAAISRKEAENKYFKN